MRSIKSKLILLVAIIAIIPLSFAGCGDDWVDYSTYTQDIFISDYTLPENFTIYYGTNDTSTPGGTSTQIRTTKIGNDWYTKSGTDNEYFFKYNYENNYTEYEMIDGTWTEQRTCDFEQMISPVLISRSGYSLCFHFLKNIVTDANSTLSETPVYQGTQNSTTWAAGYSITCEKYYAYSGSESSSYFHQYTTWMHPDYSICLRYLLQIDNYSYYYTAFSFSTSIQSWSDVNITAPQA